jgi:hypothetical protein
MKHDPIAPPPSSTDDSSGNGPHWTARKMVEFLRAPWALLIFIELISINTDLLRWVCSNRPESNG